ncbi:hypothetical protein FM106_28740 [Brachybacterium faecium]|nr:hypothetical protein FM106_28740 [Brachybacterium faecium]
MYHKALSSASPLFQLQLLFLFYTSIFTFTLSMIRALKKTNLKHFN